MLILTHYIKDNWILKLVVQSKAMQSKAMHYPASQAYNAIS
jgi:hypothetical protein